MAEEKPEDKKPDDASAESATAVVVEEPAPEPAKKKEHTLESIGEELHEIRRILDYFGELLLDTEAIVEEEEHKPEASAEGEHKPEVPPEGERKKPPDAETPRRPRHHVLK